MKKKLLALTLALLLLLSLAACGSSDGSSAPDAEDPAAGTEDANAPNGGEESAEALELNVACSAVPHAEILEEAVSLLEEAGILLNIHVYGDYIVPNTAVEEGSEDANFFQHLPYLENFNAERGTHLVSVAGIHIEPMGIYGGKTATLEELQDGASIAVPNDPTNEGRALLLLESQGLITLSESAAVDNATPNDIAENPHHLTFVELEAAMVPNVLSEVDFAVINSNYAMEASLNPVEDSLAMEDSNSPYVNVLVVREGNENDPRIVALVNALQSDSIRDFINNTYGGAVVPAF